MKRLATLFTQSYQEIRHVRTITICAMFGALSVVLGYFTLDLGPSLKLGFSGIPNRLVDYLFGPVAGGVYGGVLDVLKYIAKPTGPFFPGFSLNAMLAGVLFGSIMYRRPLTLRRVLAAKLAVVLVCNVLLNTLWLSMLYGKAFTVLLPLRLFKNLIMWPVDSLLFFSVGQVLERGGVFRAIRRGA